MENSILHAARIEQKDLEKSLSVIDAEYAAKKKSLVQRLEAVRALRSAYGDSPVSTLNDAPGALVQFVNLIVKAQTARENSHKARVLSAAVEILKGGASIRTQPLLEEIEQRGVEFTARDKAGNLSVILSKDERFVSDRRNGWSLKKENPQDAPTSAGLFAANAASN